MNLNYRYQDLFHAMEGSALEPWLDHIIDLLEHRLITKPHGDLARWEAAFAALPDIIPDGIVLNDYNVGPRTSSPLSAESEHALNNALQGLMPWRKGPFQFFDQYVDTEWRSDWKWERVAPHITPLNNRTVLDVGCGSGYHCWRMLGAGAERVIGIDPTLLFLLQCEAVKKYYKLAKNQPAKLHLLPVKMEEVTPNMQAFDTVFSMGVLYHRRSPIDHLLELKGALRTGGELVLETLVIEGKNGEILMPEDRYAMMRNVWFIPSVDTLCLWLRRSGFKNIRAVDTNQTNIEEQRTTDWMPFQSLVDFLDPVDTNKTIEGYPAPLRATIIATT